MWLIFLLENIHFALSFFAALVIFAVFWLYYEPWRERRNKDEIPLLLGYLLLAVSFVIHASFLEHSLIRTSFLGDFNHSLLLSVTRIPAYLLILLGVLLDPLPRRPGEQLNATTPTVSPWARFTPLSIPVVSLLAIAYPLLAAVIGWCYWRRATKGLERHLKPVAVSFFALSVAELLGLASLFRDTALVNLYTLTAPFGPVWIIEHLVLAAAVIIMGRWVWQYLLKRLQSQLFMIFVTAAVVIFLLTTVTFTGLLLNNIRTEILSQLQTDSKVLQLAIESKKAAMVANAEVVANHAAVIAALESGDHAPLAQLTQDLLVSKTESTLVIVTATGQVVARGEDSARTGDSLSDDPVVALATVGQPAASVAVTDGVVAPAVFVRAAVPIVANQTTIGAVVTGVILDTAFVDGIKQATGLEAAIYGGDTLSASTLTAADGRSRWIGIREENPTIRDTVLTSGQPYAGTVTILHVPYFAAYLPLFDVNQQPVGMLFSGQPQLSTWKTAGRSIELTFSLVAVLIMLSVLPAYAAAKHIVYQLR